MSTQLPFSHHPQPGLPTPPVLRGANSNRIGRIVRWLSIANLLGAGLLFVLLKTSEHWMPGTMATFAPKALFVIPSLILLLCAANWDLRSIWTNLFAAALVLGPCMGLTLPYKTLLASESTHTPLRVVTCNVQEFEPDFDSVIREIDSFNADVIALQEAKHGDPRLDEWLADWHVVHEDEFVVASRFPVEMARLIESSTSGWDRPLALAVDIDGPNGSIRFINLHLMTARPGLTGITPGQILGGGNDTEMQDLKAVRQVESYEVRQLMAETDTDHPLIVAGDFNMPSSSSLYRSVWRDLQNAFDTAGTGYGYTAPVREHRMWFDHTPWLRIDHILTNSRWTVHASQVGSGTGSDHHPVFAELQLQPKVQPQTVHSPSPADPPARRGSSTRSRGSSSR